MDPITGFGLILSLIPLFQRERDKREAARKEEFFTWLLEHNFLELKTMLESNFALGAQIEELLQMNQEKLMARFDEVDRNLFCIMSSMQEFRGLIRTVSPKAALTEQEESILTQFVESGEETLSVTKTNMRNVYSIAGFQIKDERTITSSFSRLASNGFMKECTGSKGNIYYELTEQGVEYIENLKKSDLSDQAKSILKQYVESDVQYLCMCLDEKGRPEIQAENTPIKIENSRFLIDDLEQLEKRGFIRFDGDMSSEEKRYTLTRDGEALQNG